MPQIIFISHDGKKQPVEAEVGVSLMETAIQNAIAGIDADCGGACSCATCHVYIDSDFKPHTGLPDEMEKSMLEFVDDVTVNSRLSCQITVTDDLEGMVVKTPESQ